MTDRKKLIGVFLAFGVEVREREISFTAAGRKFWTDLKTGEIVKITTKENGMYKVFKSEKDST